MIFLLNHAMMPLNMTNRAAYYGSYANNKGEHMLVFFLKSANDYSEIDIKVCLAL